jgi:hypothetical protein
VIRIHITASAYEVLAASCSRSLLETQRSPSGGYFIWLDRKTVDQLRALRGRGESYSDVILQLASLEKAS